MGSKSTTIAKDWNAKLVLTTYSDCRPDLEIQTRKGRITDPEYVDIKDPAKTVRKLAQALGVRTVPSSVHTEAVAEAQRILDRANAETSRANGNATLASRLERWLIAAETRDPDHLAEMKAANVDPHDRRLGEIIFRRQRELDDELAQLLVGPHLERERRDWERTRQQGQEQNQRLVEQADHLRTILSAERQHRAEERADYERRLATAQLDDLRREKAGVEEELRVAKAIAARRLDHLEEAWSIIANAQRAIEQVPTPGNGTDSLSLDQLAAQDWVTHPAVEWANAAVRFRESYHQELDEANADHACPTILGSIDADLDALAAQAEDLAPAERFAPMAEPAGVVTVVTSEGSNTIYGGAGPDSEARIAPGKGFTVVDGVQVHDDMAPVDPQRTADWADQLLEEHRAQFPVATTKNAEGWYARASAFTLDTMTADVIAHRQGGLDAGLGDWHGQLLDALGYTGMVDSARQDGVWRVATRLAERYLTQARRVEHDTLERTASEQEEARASLARTEAEAGKARERFRWYSKQLDALKA